MARSVKGLKSLPMFHRFEFESEFYPTLERIPFHVRMKLDMTGVKISLDTWHAFALEERWVLCHFPTETRAEQDVFVTYVNWLAEKHVGAEAERAPVLSPSLWGAQQVPEAVQRRSKANGRGVTAEQWGALAEHERYVLYKTAMSKDPDLFGQAFDGLSEKGRP